MASLMITINTTVHIKVSFKSLVVQFLRYHQRNDRNYHTNSQEMKNMLENTLIMIGEQHLCQQKISHLLHISTEADLDRFLARRPAAGRAAPTQVPCLTGRITKKTGGFS